MSPERPRSDIDTLLRRLDWPVLRRLGLHMAGAERSFLRGPGLEYADVREYQPGDDTRSIDWNLTARSDRPFVKESEPERALDAWLLLDVSRSLAWGTARYLKQQVAIEFTVAAAELLARRGNRVGALLFSRWPAAIVPPGGGRAHRLRLVAELERALESAPAVRTELGALLEQAERVVRRRALVILVTDFLSADGWEAPLARLAMRHEVVAVHLVDPRERQIPDVGVVTFEDPETGRQLTVDTTSSRLRARFEKAAADQQAQITRGLRSCRVPELLLDTDEDMLRRLVDFLRRRRALRSLRAAGRQPRPGRPWEVA